MNYSDRVRVWRKKHGTADLELVFNSVPCRFEVLSADMYSTWAQPGADYQIKQGNLRMPRTWRDLPEASFSLSDYWIEVLYPHIGWVNADGAKYWIVTNKRATRNHVVYLCTIRESA